MKLGRRPLQRVFMLIFLCSILVFTSLVKVNVRAEDNITSFITHFYEQCLNRPPDAAGLANWRNMLTAGNASGADLAFNFIYSTEFKNRNLSNDQYVDTLYKAFFNRSADAAGKSNWLGKLNEGYTRTYVFAGFVNSQEFVNLCTSYSIKPGSYTLTDILDTNPLVTTYVNRFYKECLGRNPDEAGLRNWVTLLVSGQASGADVAFGITNSQEFKARNTSNDQYLNILYKSFLNRTADAAGFSDWKAKLDAGYSRNYLLYCFVNSQEFGNLCSKYNIKPGQITLSQPRDVYPEISVFVNRFYSGTLNRLPDEAGLNDWVGRLAAKNISGADLAFGFIFSDEFKNRNLSNTEFINVLYKVFFNRQPDSTGFNTWMLQLNSGYSKKYILYNFVASQEFNNLCGKIGILYGNIVTGPEDLPTAVQPGVNKGNIINLGIIAKQDNWVYYMNMSNEGKLSKARLDGTGVQKLSEDKAAFINVLGDWIYYANISDNYSIYKVKIDGTQRTKLSNDFAEYLNVSDGWIYYQNDSDNYKLYKIKIDGTSKTKVTDDLSTCINVSGNYIYYANYSDKGQIYKVKKDGSGKEKLNEDTTESVIVDGDWIYYICASQNNEFYKIKTDGTGRARVTGYSQSAEVINVGTNWVYYISNGSIHRVSKSSFEEAVVTSSSSLLLQVIDDNIFFLTEEDYQLYKATWTGSNPKLFGADTVIASVENIADTVDQYSTYELSSEVLATMADGSNQYVAVQWNTTVDTSKAGVYTLVGTVQGYNNKVIATITVIEMDGYGNLPNNMCNAPIAARNGQWIYYSNGYSDQVSKLFKMNVDGTGKTELFTGKYIRYINVVNEWVYFVSEQSLYKMKNDGSETIKVVDDYVFTCYVVDDWIYYSAGASSANLYKVRIDGTEKIKLTDDSINYFTVYNGWIYYVDWNHYLYRIKTDGTGRQKLSNTVDNDVPNSINIVGDYIYYVGYKYNEIYQMKTDGTEKTKLVTYVGYNNQLVVGNNYAYYRDGSDLVRINLYDGTKTVIDHNDSFNSLSLVGDWIYYNNYDYSQGAYKTYRVKVDGSSKEMLQ